MGKAICERLESRRLMDAGSLDPSFGATGGYVEFAPGETFKIEGADLDVGPRGEVLATATVATGTTAAQQGAFLRLWKLHAGGAADVAFGNGGQVTLELSADVAPIGESGASAPWPAAVLAPDGTVFAAVGYRVYKFRPDGTLDRTFGRRGVAAFTDFNDPKRTLALDLDAQGRLYVAGPVGEPFAAATRVHLLRLTPGGALDTTFATGGRYVFEELRNGVNFRFNVLPDGDILIAGTASATSGVTSASTDYLAVRLDPDGSPDATYGTGGLSKRRYSFPSDDRIQHDLLLNGITDDGYVVWHFVDDGLSSGDDEDWVNAFDPGGALVEHFIKDPQSTFGQPVIRDDALFLSGAGFLDAAGNRLTAASDNFAAASAAVGAGAGAASPAALGPDGSIYAVAEVNTDTIEGQGGVLRVFRAFRDDAPVAQVTARTVAAPRTGSYRFSVQWRDDDGVDRASLGNDDLTVSFPDGTRRRARLVAADGTGNAKVVNATYRVTSADGEWDAGDNGEYTIRVERRAVRDINGNAAAQRVVGRFLVQVRPTVPVLPAAAWWGTEPAAAIAPPDLDELVSRDG